jgi:hypothetical protein
MVPLTRDREPEPDDEIAEPRATPEFWPRTSTPMPP